MKKIIPFGWTPASWGLRGKSYQIAKAEYELEGYELDVELININNPRDKELQLLDVELKHGKISQYEYDVEQVKLQKPEDLTLKLLEIDFRHNKMTEEQYDYAVVEARKQFQSEDGYNLSKLEIDYKYKKISENEYNKQYATLNGLPYIAYITSEMRAGFPSAIEFDWNDIFIKQIEEAGFIGRSDMDTVNYWFTELCRRIALEEFDGVGEFKENLEYVREKESAPKRKGRTK